MELHSTGRMVVAIASSYAAGFVGSRFMNADTALWFSRLAKPALMPESWVFLPAWLILYALMGIALGTVWAKTPLWYSWIGLFYVSLAFNAAWTMFFFGYHTIFLALIDIGCLAVLLIVLAIFAYGIDRKAAYLLLPYIGWVAFAGYLNTGIWLLN